MKIRSLFRENDQDLKWSTIYLMVVLTYIVSHGLMLVIYGAWWDDMICWNVSNELMENQYAIFNNPFVYYIDLAIAQIKDIRIMTFVYRLVPFICWFISVSAFYLFVKKICGNKLYTLYSSVLVASCGLNKCMMLICCYHYTISISLFMIGLVFFTYDYNNSKFSNKIIVAILWTLSLLVWRSAVLVVPAILIFTILSKTKIDLYSRSYYFAFFKNLFREYWIIILGILFFFFFYKTTLAPRGVYATYYSIGLKSLLLSPLTTVISSISLILGYIANLISIFSKANGPFILLPLLVICVFAILLYKTRKWEEKNGEEKNLLLIASLFLLFSVMPHTLRTFTLSFDINGYDSRVTALALFPISMIIAYMIMSVKNLKLQSVLICLLVIMSTQYSIKMYFDYEKGWLKNEALADFFGKHEELKGKNIVFIDNSNIYSPIQSEEYRYYDYEGCARLSYGIYDTTKCSGYESLKYFKRFESIDYYIFINVNERYNNIGLKSLFYRFFNSNKRDEMKKQMLSFIIQK